MKQILLNKKLILGLVYLLVFLLKVLSVKV